MTIAMYVVLILLAAVGTAVSMASGVGVGRRLSASRIGLVTSVATAMVWGVVVVSSGEITHYSGGAALTHSYPTIQWLAAGGFGVALLAAVRAAFADLSDMETRL